MAVVLYKKTLLKLVLDRCIAWYMNLFEKSLYGDILGLSYIKLFSHFELTRIRL